MSLRFKLRVNPPSGFLDSAHKRFFIKKFKDLYQINNFAFRKKTKNILAIMFLHILHMLNLKKL